jgi:hypothetical protein
MLFDDPAEQFEPWARRELEPPPGDAGAARARGGPGDGAEQTEVLIGRVRHRPAGPDEGDERFLALQLACSFLPARNTRIEWARFRVQLASDPDAEPAPIAVDLRPSDVSFERESELRLVLQPKVSFAGADVDLGVASTTVQKVKEIPIVTAAGLQNDVFYWQLEDTPEHALTGPRGFYALVAAPGRARAMTVTISVVADIVTSRGTFRGATRVHHEQEPLVQSVSLAGD